MKIITITKEKIQIRSTQSPSFHIEIVHKHKQTEKIEIMASIHNIKSCQFRFLQELCLWLPVDFLYGFYLFWNFNRVMKTCMHCIFVSCIDYKKTKNALYIAILLPYLPSDVVVIRMNNLFHKCAFICCCINLYIEVANTNYHTIPYHRIISKTIL